MKNRRLLGATLAILITGTTACSSGGQQLASDAQVVVSPSSRAIKTEPILNVDGQCLWNEANYLDMPVHVAVRTDSGLPIGGVDLLVLADWSGNTTAGGEFIKLYADRNNNGVVDDPEELVSEQGSAGARFSTGQDTGATFFLVRANLSCEYRGQVSIVGSTVAGSMTVDVGPNASL